MQASSALYADELVSALRSAKAGSGRSHGFAQVVMYLEACESGSLFDGFLHPDDTGIYVVTAAAPGENSYPAYCCDYFRPPSCSVAGQDIGSCLGDRFAVAVLEDADRAAAAETLGASFANAVAKTAPVGGDPGSTVTRFGDVQGLEAQRLAQFIGARRAVTASSHDRIEPIEAAASAIRIQPRSLAPPLVTPAAADEVFTAVLADRMGLPTSAAQGTAAVTLSPLDMPCYKRLNALLDARCQTQRQPRPPVEPARGSASPYRLMLRACQAGNAWLAAQAIEMVCESGGGERQAQPKEEAHGD